MSFFMTMIICAVVCGVISAVLIWAYAETDSVVCFLLGALFAVVSFFVFVGIACFAVDWHASEYKAKIINREYGTSYTSEEIFFASDVIDTIREIERTRIEANGNLMGGENTKETN